MYTGTVRLLGICKNRICSKCRGSGCAHKNPEAFGTCEKCHGKGTHTIIMRTAPGVESRIVRDCYLCWGKGEAIAQDDRCTKCGGEGVVEVQSFLQVNVKRGARHGQKIIFKSEGTQEPNMRPGDVYVILEALDHPIFKRKGDDLHMNMDLLLVESLCGFRKLVETLDKRKLAVICPRGKVITNNEVKYLPGEGMPIYGDPTKKGKLIIHFGVIEPDNIRTRHIKTLEQCLPPREPLEIPIDAKECNMVNIFLILIFPMPNECCLNSVILFNRST